MDLTKNPATKRGDLVKLLVEIVMSTDILFGAFVVILTAVFLRRRSFFILGIREASK